MTLEFDHLEIAELLTHTCVVGYRDTATGIAPERMEYGKVYHDNDQINIYGEKKHTSYSINTAYSLLRPETVESLYVLWIITGDEKYRRWGWDIFEAFKQHARDPATGAYCSLRDVRRLSTRKDETESFFMAETLKYLYLLFEDPNLFSLFSLVLNTEAHPLDIFVQAPPQK